MHFMPIFGLASSRRSIGYRVCLVWHHVQQSTHSQLPIFFIFDNYLRLHHFFSRAGFCSHSRLLRMYYNCRFKIKIIISNKICSVSRFEGDTFSKSYFTREDLRHHGVDEYESWIYCHTTYGDTVPQKWCRWQLTSGSFTASKTLFPSSPTMRLRPRRKVASFSEAKISRNFQKKSTQAWSHLLSGSYSLLVLIEEILLLSWCFA